MKIPVFKPTKTTTKSKLNEQKKKQGEQGCGKKTTITRFYPKKPRDNARDRDNVC